MWKPVFYTEDSKDLLLFMMGPVSIVEEFPVSKASTKSSNFIFCAGCHKRIVPQADTYFLVRKKNDGDARPKSFCRYCKERHQGAYEAIKMIVRGEEKELPSP